MTDRFIRKFGPGGGLMIPIQSFESNNLNAPPFSPCFSRCVRVCSVSLVPALALQCSAKVGVATATSRDNISYFRHLKLGAYTYTTARVNTRTESRLR